MTAAAGVRLDGVTVRYGDTAAVDDLNLDVPAGRTTVLLGPSGCGKSTVLRLVIGLIEPTEGRVEAAGRPVVPETLLELRRRTGYVIQEGGLFPHLTAARNVLLMPRHLGWPPQRRKERLEELCALARLDREMLDRYPAELSGGQRQRVALMRALVLQPALLLLDEPLGALDPLVRADLQADLREIFARLGTTVLLVTHDLAEAAFLGDEIVLMEAGRAVQRGTLDDLRTSPATAFVERFVSAQAGPVP